MSDDHARIEEQIAGLRADLRGEVARLDGAMISLATSVGERIGRAEDLLMVELRAVRAAQEAEVSDRSRVREARYGLARELCASLLRPQVLVPLVVLALAGMALLTGAGIRYGDLIIEAASGAQHSVADEGEP